MWCKNGRWRSRIKQGFQIERKNIVKPISILLKQLLCKHTEQECITNFSGEYINNISNSKYTYRSAWRCVKCNKLIYHEESNPDCNIINWQAKDY